MESLLVALGFGTLLLGFYLFTYLGNKQTPRPEGCDLDAASCGTCSSHSCGLASHS